MPEWMRMFKSHVIPYLGDERVFIYNETQQELRDLEAALDNLPPSLVVMWVREADHARKTMQWSKVLSACASLVSQKKMKVLFLGTPDTVKTMIVKTTWSPDKIWKDFGVIPRVDVDCRCLYLIAVTAHPNLMKDLVNYIEGAHSASAREMRLEEMRGTWVQLTSRVEPPEALVQRLIALCKGLRSTALPDRVPSRPADHILQWVTTKWECIAPYGKVPAPRDHLDVHGPIAQQIWWHYERVARDHLPPSEFYEPVARIFRIERVKVREMVREAARRCNVDVETKLGNQSHKQAQATSTGGPWAFQPTMPAGM